VREARVRIDAYMRFYNNERPHQSLGYRTPAQTYNEAQDQLSIEVDPKNWTGS
ncbi:MAG: transposase, partial [Chloroflexi bacterium]|nr:transposase [Chloroflexota bacterium]